jgi:hypothetical protein
LRSSQQRRAGAASHSLFFGPLCARDPRIAAAKDQVLADNFLQKQQKQREATLLESAG